jgi:TM2 domain-containing membrane protein YozV
MRFAERELAAGNTESGLLALQRVAFFAPDSMLPEVYGILGTVYEGQKRFSEASYCYDRAFESSITDTMRIDFAFKAARCELQNDNLEYASAILLQLPENLPYESERRRQFYWAILQFRKADFESSRQSFILSLDTTNRTDSLEINRLFANHKALYRPIPERARIMSLIIPGSGQFYAGNFREGANSLILSASLFGVALVVSSRYGYWNGLLTVMPWFQRYYTGGYKNAYLIAESQRERRRMVLLGEVMHVLENRERAGN